MRKVKIAEVVLVWFGLTWLLWIVHLLGLLFFTNSQPDMIMWLATNAFVPALLVALALTSAVYLWPRK